MQSLLTSSMVWSILIWIDRDLCGMSESVSFLCFTPLVRFSQQHEAQMQDHGLHNVCCIWSPFGKAALSVSRPIYFFSLFSTLALLPELTGSDIIHSHLKPEFWDTCLAWWSFPPSLLTASVTKLFLKKQDHFGMLTAASERSERGALFCKLPVAQLASAVNSGWRYWSGSYFSS